MEINVSQLLKGPIGESREYELTEMVDVNNDGETRQVRGDISLLRTQQGVLVRAVLRTEIYLECSRCLRRFARPATLRIEEEFLPTVDIITGASLPPPEEPGSFIINGRQVINLTEAIRQYAVLAEPLKPLCREDCAGICPECGQNLNLAQCDCSKRAVDPRLAELLKLLHK